MAVLGVDIGVTGAIALLSDAGELLEVIDMPTLADGPPAMSKCGCVRTACYSVPNKPV
jgi:hypothetical protein